ncbi:hypothetical protein GCM10023205_16340 [Yinghuangia aomiensis]|uniref:Endonuclease/Exonuclease/phosphatase family protein n=1 Tax=Yinghuangia aomiensis TaxID=676205 RepID=A0ABP9GWN8_9ACTN
MTYRAPRCIRYAARSHLNPLEFLGYDHASGSGATHARDLDRYLARTLGDLDAAPVLAGDLNHGNPGTTLPGVFERLGLDEALDERPTTFWGGMQDHVLYSPGLHLLGSGIAPTKADHHLSWATFAVPDAGKPAGSTPFALARSAVRDPAVTGLIRVSEAATVAPPRTGHRVWPAVRPRADPAVVARRRIAPVPRTRLSAAAHRGPPPTRAWRLRPLGNRKSCSTASPPSLPRIAPSGGTAGASALSSAAGSGLVRAVLSAWVFRGRGRRRIGKMECAHQPRSSRKFAS